MSWEGMQQERSFRKASFTAVIVAVLQRRNGHEVVSILPKSKCF